MLLLGAFLSAPAAHAQAPELRTAFRIKYVAEGAVYLDGGRSVGLAEGLKLVVKRAGISDLPSGSSEVKAVRIIAQLKVTSVADSSAVCEVDSRSAELVVGDIAYLTPESIQAVLQQRAASGARRYLQVITFTDSEDPFEAEVRAAVPRPPLPEVNRARGRLGLDYSAIHTRGTGARSSQLGVVMRMDVTRIGGSYWNFSGYWRGRVSSRSDSTQQTLNDLISRTYHLGFTYSNPGSRWTAGVGRLFVPWATSLSTIDGGYLGRRFGRSTTVGLFAGSTPDPTSWNYNPDRRIAGTLVNFEGGSFTAFRYVSTFGVAVSSIRWRIERPFAFFENSFFYKRYFSLYHTLEADRPRPPAGSTAQISPGVSRSYVTLRIQPHDRFSFDISHNYFRDIPTFDPRLVGTGLLDKLLFQGLSGGARVELPKRVSLYTSVGRSTRTGDTRSSWNQMYGVTLGEIWRTGIRADARYSKFDSSFGSGSYRSLSLSRYFGESLRLDVQGGLQNFVSPLTQETRSRFLNTMLDWTVGKHYFLEGGFTLERGGLQSYDQWFVTTGYRF